MGERLTPHSPDILCASKGIAMSSPTQRSLAVLRSEGWTCQITERWNPFSKTRQDLFGFCDILAMSPTLGFLAVQTTSSSNLAARITKIKNEARAGIFLASGGKIAVHGWSKKGPRGKRKAWSLSCRWIHNLTDLNEPA